EWAVCRARPAWWLVRLGRDDRGRQVPVIEQRRVGGEAFLTHQLFRVERAVRLPKLSVTLGRQIADPTVVGHRSSRALDRRVRLQGYWVVGLLFSHFPDRTVR